MSGPHGIMKSTGCNYTPAHKLELIEGCYEIWPWRSEDALRWGRFNRPERFRRIMKNIIRNKGTFVPSDVRP